MQELSKKIIDFAKIHKACKAQLTPTLIAYETGDYETVMATACKDKWYYLSIYSTNY